MIRVRFNPMADRRRCWSVWVLDPKIEAPLLVGYVRRDLLSWIARTRDLNVAIKDGFHDRHEAAAWILIRSRMAQPAPGRVNPKCLVPRDAA